MIPRKIQIKNFLSYGSQMQTIEFTKHKLICLSGKNGHGKSALLDAITWAVWGQARKIGATAKPDQGLLKIGEVEMTVIFDFEFNHQLYRVKRDFSQKYGKPHAHVEFGLLKEQDYYVSLSEKTIRRTQEIIEQTIGLDFDTFVNSCFLRQGGANEFSKKSAKERKEVLSTILGLARYDKARTLALEQSRTIATEITHFEKLQEHSNQEFELLKTVPEQQEQLIQKLTHITTTQQEQHQQEQEFKKQLEILQKQEQQKTIIETHYQQNQLQKKEQTAQFSQLVNLWKQTHHLILALPNKDLLEQQLEKITQEYTQLQKQFEDSLKNKELLLTHKEQLQTLITQQTSISQQQTEQYKLNLERLKTELTQQEKRVLTITREQKETEQKQEQLQKQLLALQQQIIPDYLLAGYQEQLVVFERHKGHYQRWVQQGNWITAQLAELNQKQSLSQDPNDPSCPLCEQNLSQARKRFLQKKFQDQQLLLQHTLHRITVQIKKLKEYLHTQHTQLQKLKELEQLRANQEQLAEIFKTFAAQKQEQEQVVAATHKQIKELEKEQKNMQEQQQKQEQENSQLQKLKNSITTLETELLTHSHKPEQYQKIQQEKLYLEEQLKNCQQLPIYQAAQKERFNTVHQLKKTLNSLQMQEEKLQKALQDFYELPTQQETTQKNLDQLMQTSKQLHQEKEQLLQQKGTLEAQAQKLETLKKQQQEYAHKMHEYKIQLFDLQQISIALGKDGIQALLIEDAIPEIEQEANDLLARLTDNQAQISIESLRDLKKGGTRETLDINISDTQGIRPYELFSGGEAFRIDFALRIAISKLLARRAGTSLQTLIIDEGFGSQDDEGLTRMMDALYTIQDDFEKIIIVSHLQSMKEQFPVHFYIQKTPNGSTVTIIEH